MARINVGEITLNVEEAGTGPVFIFVPGLVEMLNAWAYQIAHFFRSYRRISFDHRGASDFHNRPLDQYSTEAIAADVITLMDTLDIERAPMAGNSTDTAILQNLAIGHLERLACCIFSNNWTKADENRRRMQTALKQNSLSKGSEAYVRISSLFTISAMQFRYNLDQTIEVEERSLETITAPDVLAVGHSYRHHGALHHHRRLIDGGELGRARLAKGVFSNDNGLALEAGVWCTDPAKFPGGCLMQIGNHQIDNLLCLLGPISDVSAYFGHLETQPEVEEVPALLMRFERGAIGFVAFDYISPRRFTLTLHELRQTPFRYGQ